jgi:ABC-type Fe3+/spermidine/putrescine transport system ATPase subunit
MRSLHLLDSIEMYMKQRLIVMNEQRIVQSDQAGQWKNESIGKANGVKPGIYNIFSSVPADKAKEFVGIVLHIDKESVFQQVGKDYILHSRKDFDTVPSVGASVGISYGKSGKAVILDASVIKLGKKLSR